jgi:hypothetical protein
VATPANGKAGLPPWQTIIAILAAFIVGLLPFVLGQGKYATKEDLNVIADRQQIVLQRLAANDENIASNTQAFADLIARVAATESRLTALELRMQAVELELGLVSTPPIIGGPTTG